MFSLERWQEIFETISKNKLRTFLTGLSVASGIFILVILLGFNSGIANGVKAAFEEDATNRISIWTGVTSKEYKGLNPGRFVQLRNEDYQILDQKYDDQIEKLKKKISKLNDVIMNKDSEIDDLKNRLAEMSSKCKQQSDEIKSMKIEYEQLQKNERLK